METLKQPVHRQGSGKDQGQVQEITPPLQFSSVLFHLPANGREGGAETELSCRQKLPPETALKQNQQD